MKYSLTILPFLICVLTFCGRQDVITESLDRAESCMSDRPDSALAILEAMDSTHFNSRRQNARYALLKSMALDKNYIDRTDDSLVNVAVNYYRHRCNPAYKFKSYYYQARIYQNADQLDKAMASLVRAEHVEKKHIEASDLARLHIAKSRILIERYDYSDELLAELKNVELYSKEAGNADNYVSSLLDQAETYIIRDEFEEASLCLDVIRDLDTLSRRSMLGYNKTLLWLSVKSKQPVDSISAITQKYLDIAEDSTEINWEYVAEAYMKSGESMQALKALHAQSLFNDVSEDEAYYYLLSKTRLKLGDYALAYGALHKYSEISDSLDMVKMSQEVKSVEEKYEKNLLIRRQRLTICVAALILIFSMTIFIIYVRKKKSSEERLRRKYNDLKDEYEFLKKAQERILPEADEEAHRILERRIKALGHFLSKDTPDSLSKVADKLEDLTADKNTVTDSIGMLYAMYHPNFVLKLEEYGLTASEVGFCCLLVLGLKTSELSMVVNKSNTYNISSRIRAKLKLEHNSGKLSNWLTDLYAASEDEHKPVTDIL